MVLINEPVIDRAKRKHADARDWLTILFKAVEFEVGGSSRFAVSATGHTG